MKHTCMHTILGQPCSCTAIISLLNKTIMFWLAILLHAHASLCKSSDGSYTWRNCKLVCKDKSSLYDLLDQSKHKHKQNDIKCVSLYY